MMVLVLGGSSEALPAVSGPGDGHYPFGAGFGGADEGGVSRAS